MRWVRHSCRRSLDIPSGASSPGSTGRAPPDRACGIGRSGCPSARTRTGSPRSRSSPRAGRAGAVVVTRRPRRNPKPQEERLDHPGSLFVNFDRTVGLGSLPRVQRDAGDEQVALRTACRAMRPRPPRHRSISASFATCSRLGRFVAAEVAGAVPGPRLPSSSCGSTATSRTQRLTLLRATPSSAQISAYVQPWARQLTGALLLDDLASVSHPYDHPQGVCPGTGASYSPSR